MIGNSETPTPTTPVTIGSTAAQIERKTSSRMIRAASTPMISVIPPAEGFTVKAFSTGVIGTPSASRELGTTTSASCGDHRLPQLR
jgi:hypothetical protein